MPVVVPFSARRAPASGIPAVSVPGRHSLGVTAYHLKDSAVRWRTTTIGHALVRAEHDIHWGRSHFINLVDCRDSDPDARESATVVAARRTQVLILGNTWFAAEIRERLTKTRGLSLLPLPGPTTPLTHLILPMSRRLQKLLERVGFSSVEELASVSTACWDELHGFGPKAAEELAQVLNRQQQPRPRREATARRELITSGLQSHDVERHAPMIDRLAASALPVDAAVEVCRRLALEDLPPTDPDVTTLLGSPEVDPALLEFYVRTHQTPRWPEA